MSECQASLSYRNRLFQKNRLGESRISLPVSHRLFMKSWSVCKFSETYVQAGAYTVCVCRYIYIYIYVLLNANLNCLFFLFFLKK